MHAGEHASSGTGVAGQADPGPASSRYALWRMVCDSRPAGPPARAIRLAGAGAVHKKSCARGLVTALGCYCKRVQLDVRVLG